MLYQIVVIGLGLTLLFGGGYYIARTDTNGVLRSTLSEEKKVEVSETTEIESSGDISSSTDSMKDIETNPKEEIILEIEQNPSQE